MTHTNLGIAARYIIGAVMWGAFFSVAPILEVLTPGAILWLPILVFCEWRRSRRFGFLPGAPIRLAVAGMVVIAAIFAPLKYLDRSVGPFPTSPVPIDDVQAVLREHDVWIRLYPERHDQVVALPASRVNLRDLFASIKQQTGLQYRIGYCGNGKSLLFGPHPIFITFEAPATRRRAA